LTNVLVYRFDPCFPNKQAIATQLLREGLSTDSIRIPHQAVLEFMAVVTRVKIGTEPLEPFLWRLPAMRFQRNSNQPAPFDELQCNSPGTPSAEPQHFPRFLGLFRSPATGLHVEADSLPCRKYLNDCEQSGFADL
jgi:hypothetical protein